MEPLFLTDEERATIVTAVRVLQEHPELIPVELEEDTKLSGESLDCLAGYVNTGVR